MPANNPRDLNIEHDSQWTSNVLRSVDLSQMCNNDGDPETPPSRLS